ncbi:hypothetical protein ACIQAM_05665 [Streptomyces goshikiensis]|uniref:hypothetical protein n=1 Tax=Streptomyces goshikiensis TaxID=1942 RepID=UPI0038212083
MKGGANGSYAVADLNGDGRPDLAASSAAAGVAAQVLLNTSKPNRTAQSMSVQVAKAPGVLSMEVNPPAVSFDTLAPAPPAPRPDSARSNTPTPSPPTPPGR